MKQVLTIAGSDSSAGAGVQADLGTFHTLGAHGFSVVTAITAQNSVGVQEVFPAPSAAVRAQLESVFDDFTVAAAKTGMLANAEIIDVVAEVLRKRFHGPLVIDPVLRAGSGESLLGDDAWNAMKTRLLPMAAVVTPNLPEAEALIGASISSIGAMREAAAAIAAMGPGAVVVKGGHAAFAPAVDVVFDGVDTTEMHPGALAPDHIVHGTGCVFSAALAVSLARGDSVIDAARLAKRVVTAFIQQSVRLGAGAAFGMHVPPSAE